MKKLIPLVLLLTVTFFSFSQTVTNPNSIQSDTIVALKVPIAKLVIKDLIIGDGAIAELDELKKIIELTNEKLVLKDTIISGLKTKSVNLEKIISQKDEQFKLERQKSDELLKELKSEKRKTFFYKVGTYAAGVFGLLYITK